jgi:hypothetical protein
MYFPTQSLDTLARPSSCTTRSERVYVKASCCETDLGVTRGDSRTFIEDALCRTWYSHYQWCNSIHAACVCCGKRLILRATKGQSRAGHLSNRSPQFKPPDSTFLELLGKRPSRQTYDCPSIQRKMSLDLLSQIWGPVHKTRFTLDKIYNKWANPPCNNLQNMSQ